MQKLANAKGQMEIEALIGFAIAGLLGIIILVIMYDPLASILFNAINEADNLEYGSWIITLIGLIVLIVVVRYVMALLAPFRRKPPEQVYYR